MEIPKARYKYNQQPAKRHRPRRVIGWVLGLALLFSSSGYSFFALTDTIPQLSAAPAAIQAKAAGSVEISWPSDGQSAVGGLREGLLAKSTQNEEARPIASMAKTITALAVLEKSPLELGEQGRIYTVTRADVVSYNEYIAKLGSVMPVRAGQKLTQYQMLQALMLPSANNIADSLVTWIFGSEEAYIEYANKLVKSWGLQNTVVNDASGFSDGTVSTASELIAIGQKALQNPVIAEIVATKRVTIPESGTLNNTNRLLADNNVVGIKTGNTDEAGSCLLFAVKHGPDKSDTLIGVVMGAPNGIVALKNARQLRDSALKNFGSVEVLSAGSVVGNYDAPWGQSSDIITAEPISTYGWNGAAYEVKVNFETAESPLKKNQVIGRATLEGYEVSVDLVAESEITPPSKWWKLSNYWH